MWFDVTPARPSLFCSVLALDATVRVSQTSSTLLANLTLPHAFCLVSVLGRCAPSLKFPLAASRFRYSLSGTATPPPSMPFKLGSAVRLSTHSFLLIVC